MLATPPECVGEDAKLAHLHTVIEACRESLGRIEQRYAAMATLHASPTPPIATLPITVSTLDEVDADELALSELDTQLTDALTAVAPRQWLAAAPLTSDSSSMLAPTSSLGDAAGEGDAGDDSNITSASTHAAAVCATGYGVLAQLLRLRRALVAHFGASVTREMNSGVHASGVEDSDASASPFFLTPVSPLRRTHAHHHMTPQLDALRQREDECLDNALALERSAMLAESGVFAPVGTAPIEAATTTGSSSSGPAVEAGSTVAAQTDEVSALLPHTSPHKIDESLSAGATATATTRRSGPTASATKTITSDEQLLQLSLRRGQHAAERGDASTAAEDFALVHNLLFQKLLLVEELIGYALASAEESTQGDHAEQNNNSNNGGGVDDDVPRANTDALFDPSEHLLLPPGLDEEDYEEERLYNEQKKQNSDLPSSGSIVGNGGRDDHVTAQQERVVRGLQRLLAKVHADALPIGTIEARFRLLLSNAIHDGRATMCASEKEEAFMPSMQNGAGRTASFIMAPMASAAAASSSASQFSLTVLLGQIAWDTGYCAWVDGFVPHARAWVLAMNLPKLVRRTRTALRQYARELEEASQRRRGGGHLASEVLMRVAGEVADEPNVSQLDVPTISWGRVLSGCALHAQIAASTVGANTHVHDANSQQQQEEEACETGKAESAELLDQALTLLQRASTLLAVCEMLMYSRSTDDIVHLAQTFSWALAEHARKAKACESSGQSIAAGEDETAEALVVMNHCIEHLLTKRACKLYLTTCAAKESEKQASKVQWGTRTEFHAALATLHEDPRRSSSLDDVQANAAAGVISDSSTLTGSTTSSRSTSRSQSQAADATTTTTESGMKVPSHEYTCAHGTAKQCVLTPEEYQQLEESAVRTACDELVFAFTGGALATLQSLEVHGVPFPGSEQGNDASSSASILRPGISTTLAANALSSVLNFSSLFRTSPHYHALRASTVRAYRRRQRRAVRAQREKEVHRRQKHAHPHGDFHGPPQAPAAASDTARAEENEPDTESLLLGYVEATFVGRTAREKVLRYRTAAATPGGREEERPLTQAGRHATTPHRSRRSASSSAKSDTNSTTDGGGGGGGWFDLVRGAAAGFFAAVVPPSPAPLTTSTPSPRSSLSRSASSTTLATTTSLGEGTGRRNQVRAPAVKPPFGAVRLPSCAYTVGGILLFPYECTERLSSAQDGQLDTHTAARRSGEATTRATTTTATEGGQGVVDERQEEEDRAECCVRVVTFLQRFRLLANGLAVISTPSLCLGGVSLSYGSVSSASRHDAFSNDEAAAASRGGPASPSSAASPSALIVLDQQLLTFISQELNKAVHLLPRAVHLLGPGTTPSTASSPRGVALQENSASARLTRRLAELQRVYLHALSDAGAADERRRRERDGHTQHPHRHRRATHGSPDTAAASSSKQSGRRCPMPLPPHALLSAVSCTNLHGITATTSPALPPSFAQIVMQDSEDAAVTRGEMTLVPFSTPAGTLIREDPLARRRTSAQDTLTTDTSASPAEDTTKESLSALWWGRPLAVPRQDALQKKRQAQQGRPDPRGLSPSSAARSGETDADVADGARGWRRHGRTHRDDRDEQASSGETGATDSAAAVLAFAAPPVFLPEITIDFSGFTTSSIHVQHATREMVKALQEKQAAAEAAATTQAAKLNVRGVSMLTPACALLLHNELPMLQQYSNWRLIYSTRLHGMSMQTILRCCAKEQEDFRRRRNGGLPHWQQSSASAHAATPGPPMLLVMELPPSTSFGFSTDDRGVREVAAAQRNPNVAPPTAPPHRMLIGAYLSDALSDETRRYYGTSDTFVFQILLPSVTESGAGAELKHTRHADDTKPRLRAFHGCFGENTHFINVRHAPNSIVIGGGGGGSALYIDETLAHGATSGCTTFQSPPLTEWLENGSPNADSGAAAATFASASNSRSFDVLQLEVLVMDS